MPLYNFKTIQVVPSGKDFIDIVLSKTQRQTPTVVHNGWAIQRIRAFYMRKVKFTQQNWHEKLGKILDDFPKVDDIHPFYADLLNVLYDRDHYKLALGQLHTARNLITKVSQDYVRLLKYGDSLYRCKELKRAALGRMCTIMKKHGPSLAYLEQVRQHMSRLPSIDPNTRTLLVCGYPNVGKSSFMNKVTRADVDVQPYAFTTKSLFVGHMDYKYLRWQVIDTPGILDRPLEERNTIEMQSVTALAHLRAAVLYVLDISEQCGYTIAQQAALFNSIKPLFSNKPLLIVLNKTDVVKVADLPAEDQQLLKDLAAEAARCSAGGAFLDGFDAAASAEASLLAMSTLTEEGIMDVKQVACDRLLASRVDTKLQSKRASGVLNNIHVAMPKPRDSAPRQPCIPASVLQQQARLAEGPAGPKRTERDLQEENGGAGVYSMDYRKLWQLKDPSWQHDIVPEIIDGHNILDFVDPDIDAKLVALEQEEDMLASQHIPLDGSLDALESEETELLRQIRARKAKLIAEHRVKKSVGGNRSVLPRTALKNRKTAADMQESLEQMGVDGSAAVERARSQSRVGRKRARSSVRFAMDVDQPADETAPKRIHSSKSRSMSRGRSFSTASVVPGRGLKDDVQRNKAIKMGDKAQFRMGKAARKGEADRHIPTLRPKHLMTGKRKKGSTDWR